jgi:hypothetical protein
MVEAVVSARGESAPETTVSEVEALAPPPSAASGEDTASSGPSPGVALEESDPAGAPLVVPAPAASTQETREAAAARVRAALVLPPALRDRLASAVLVGGECGADGQPRIALDAAVRAIEEALPAFLRPAEAPVQPVHPAGEAFFRSGEGELSEEAAEALARGQLARCGLLRGQG